MQMGMMGLKVGMTQVFSEEGKIVPVTIISVGPCQILELKEYKNHSSLVLGYQEKVKNLIKSVEGHFARLSKNSGKKITPKRYLKEFKLENISSYSAGDILDVNVFNEQEKVTVVAVSKGKGTQGVVKRHNMSGGPASHGSHFHRKPGSIAGGSSFPARVWKGHRMSGRMGNESVTVKNLTVFKIDHENNLLYIKGAVPGSKRSLVVIKK